MRGSSSKHKGGATKKSTLHLLPELGCDFVLPVKDEPDGICTDS